MALRLGSEGFRVSEDGKQNDRGRPYSYSAVDLIKIKKSDANPGHSYASILTHGGAMNAELLDDGDHQTIDDINWLSNKVRFITHKEERYFTDTVKDALARGWGLMYARHYALGKLMGTH